ncbi:universal stress protein [Azotobacter beijerinckii]|uniref:universal stress protein n=1 Tax=Azotobacter beijerinckii TaxID=170623 RepID=UPI002955A27B|nr:universal stress protein [Azotobacter beijerinckii]MDV7209738.1 universal stress protein [Azotobacter beijerinckii]
MSQFQRLFLVVTPDMCRTPAFERAVALARVSGAPLHMAVFTHVETLAAVGRINPEGMKQAVDSYLAGHREWLEEEASILRSQGLEVTTEVVWTKHPAEEIIDHVRQMPAGMLIKDVRPESAVMRAFVTPLDWQLLRRCPVPLHLVTDAHNPVPLKVAAAVDPFVHADGASEFNDRIVRAAEGLALLCRAELHLLHACNATAEHFGSSLIRLPWLEGLQKRMRTGAEEVFTILANRHGVPPKQRHFLLGPPVPTLTDYAVRSEIDVVVLGSSLRKSFEHEILGSTSEALLYRLPCSVLVVHPEGVCDPEHHRR